MLIASQNIPDAEPLHLLGWCEPSVVVIELRPEPRPNTAGPPPARFRDGAGMRLVWKLRTQGRDVDGYGASHPSDGALEFESDAGTYLLTRAGQVALRGGAGRWDVRAWATPWTGVVSRPQQFWLTRSYAAGGRIVAGRGHTHARALVGSMQYLDDSIVTVPAGVVMALSAMPDVDGAAGSIVQTGVRVL
ncbi:uncharacterized protein SOCE26_052740 [Sorangium cellulosum]|uniref:Uncharacterized protein n=1 Tax=Sorangium cellulosum TaxID=56 RepID=A0A2L0EX45_SORCE|nr:hypothetical protein [Sorangium cellulosum]AUX43819.1 uncharacterized protein SOCE26_052740 [Sorangium cellulosum]